MENTAKDFSSHETLIDMLKKSAQKYPSRSAFMKKTKDGKIEHISYEKYFNDVMRLAYFLNNKLKLHDKKIAVCLNNCYEWCISYMAVCSGVGVVVPLDKDMLEEELINIIEFAQISAIIVDKRNAQRLLAVYEKLPQKFIIISSEEVEDKRVLYIQNILNENEGAFENENKNIDPNSLAVLIFTSGTTGMAKGVMLSNRNILSDMKAVSKNFSLSCSDSTLCVLPLHHAYQSIVFLMINYIGGCISFNTSLRYIKEDLQTYKPTVFVTVPLMIEKMYDKIMKEAEKNNKLSKALLFSKTTHVISNIISDDIKKKLFSKIHNVFGGKMRFIITGAAMMNEKTAADYQAFGIPIIIGYGLTECSPIAICNSENDPRPNSIGKPLESAQVKIDAPNKDGIGEICIKGPMVMLGYYKKEQKTAEVIKDGWLHTGDLGYKDNDGFYHISGRIKNVIVTKNGKNIYPEEIEYYLSYSALITEAIVFSNKGEDETVSASIYPNLQLIKQKLNKDNPNCEEIYEIIYNEIISINKKLPSYKRIRKVYISNHEFEKNAAHKIVRNGKVNFN